MTHPVPPIAAGQRRTSASPTVLAPVPVSESSNLPTRWFGHPVRTRMRRQDSHVEARGIRSVAADQTVGEVPVRTPARGCQIRV
jgi:hypothetical protein